MLSVGGPRWGLGRAQMDALPMPPGRALDTLLYGGRAEKSRSRHQLAGASHLYSATTPASASITSCSVVRVASSSAVSTTALSTSPRADSAPFCLSLRGGGEGEGK